MTSGEMTFGRLDRLLLSRMAHMMTRMTRMTHWLDSHDSLARWLAVCQDPERQIGFDIMNWLALTHE